MAEKAQPNMGSPADLPDSGADSQAAADSDAESTARSRISMLRSKAQWRIEPSTGDAPAAVAPAKAQPAPTSGSPDGPKSQPKAAPQAVVPAVGKAGAAPAEQAPSADSGGKPAIQILKQQVAAAAGDQVEAPKEAWQVAPSSVDFEDPLVSCLSILASLLQRPISETALKSGLPHDAGAFTPELAIQAAERAGLSARVMRRPKLANILPLTLPCILLLKGKSACVLQRYVESDKAEIVHPDGGTKTIDRAELAVWT